MCWRVMRLVTSVHNMCINYVYNYNNYVTKINIDHLASCQSKNLAHAAFFSHSDIGNVTVNCLFTPGQALLMYLYAYACLLLLGHVVSEVRVSGGAFLNHPCIDARIYVTALQYSTVHWYSQCSVHTGYVLCGTLVVKYIISKHLAITCLHFSFKLLYWQHAF